MLLSNGIMPSFMFTIFVQKQLGQGTPNDETLIIDEVKETIVFIAFVQKNPTALFEEINNNY